MQAKARQKALERSTAVLTAATDEAANTLENLFNVRSSVFWLAFFFSFY